MVLLAADSKEFKRASIERTPAGDPIVRDPKAFYTQLGVGVVISDPEKFQREFPSAFAVAAGQHRVKLPRQFGSSRFVIDDLFARRYPDGRAFLYKVIDQVQHLIDHIDVSWLIASPKSLPTVRVGGLGAGHREQPLQDFLADAGNVYPMISGWLYTKLFPSPAPDMVLDHFQAKPSRAWSDLSSGVPSLKIVPKGDECNPFICAADILAYLTDKGLHAERQKLFPSNVNTLWRDRPFSVRAGYLDPEVFPEIAAITNSSVDLHSWYPSPMTYLMVDQGLLSDPVTAPTLDGTGTPSDSRVTYRNLVESSGFANSAILSAQLDGGGFKFFDAPTDAGGIRDGDRLVYFGKNSKSRAETIQTGLDVEVESVRELRERLRPRGFSC